MWSGVILNFFSLIRSSYLDRRSVSYLSVFRQYFPDFAGFQFAFCLIFLSHFRFRFDSCKNRFGYEEFFFKIRFCSLFYP
ncbi:hypothetical protein B2G47_11050 [Leptospira interrogans serovar Canicola]|nr:hypothetical protein B2G47_11050 [Leptospira interrogans serovar Canicola]